MQRKVVTILFCDVTGSTALGESVDPEALRALLAGYFERMKAIVETHGGTVEKFIGDAVMAVFGVPMLHEDDALRAVRAAAEMRNALPELGMQARIGVNSGEVVTGTEERLATGDAVNVAARLEQAAAANEVLLGEPTLALVREAVQVEPLAPLSLKGKAEPVRAYRLVRVREAPERRHEALFVGRQRELEIVRDGWERALVGRRCELVTVVGDAGVGKSRLAAEFLAGLDARVVRGRCLPYGEGITYWPVVEVVKQLDARPSDDLAAHAIRSLLGETDVSASAEEIAWAFRKLLEEQAPLVVVFDDIQWGEETFLDLIDHIVLLSRGAPILLLCLARPDLLERRPSWPVALRLEPLPKADVDALIPDTMEADVREQIARAAGGNPLFIGEMLAMAAEGNGELVVPPTLKALLAARIDQLDPSERGVLERGAVEGEIFHRGAVQALAPEETQVTPRLAALVRKQLIRPDRAHLPAEDAFRFRHLLIRDSAYDALPKAVRAELHERFAAWLEERGVDLVELDEILGHHLEQAARYKQELGQPDAVLAERAGERLATAGRRAVWRGDIRAASALLERALALLRPMRLDVELELDLAHVQPTPRQGAEVADAAAERARADGDRAGEMAARVVAASYRLLFEADFDVDELEVLGRAALPLLEQAGNHSALVYVWSALGNLAAFHGHMDDVVHAGEEAIRHSRLAGERWSHLFGLHGALVFGPRPADEALRTLDAALHEAPHPGMLSSRAMLLAMLRRFEEASPMASEAGERLRELTGKWGGEFWLAHIETLAGDHDAAAGHMRRHCDLLEEIGLRGELSTYAPALGRSLCALGRHDEAEPLAQLGRELGGERDMVTQALWRQVQALVDAHRGQHAEAESLAREAVAITERTDMLNLQGDALCDLAEVLHAAGRAEEAGATLTEALERYERKRNLAMAAQVRERLALLEAAPMG